MVEIVTVLFVLELSLFLFVDWFKYNTLYTPVFFLGVPFAVVLLFAVSLGPLFGFLPLTVDAVIVWCIGILIFWFSGALLTYATVNNRLILPFTNISTCRSVTKTIEVVSWLFISILFCSFLNSFARHGTIGGEAFSADFASHGIAAHCLSLMKYNAAYLFVAEDGRKKQRNIIVIVTFVFLLLYNVKGAIILTALVSLFAKFILYQSKLDLKKIMTIMLLGIIVFVLSYGIALGTINYKFLTFHFLAYVIAGIVGLSEYLRQGLPVDFDFLHIIQPMKNIYNVLMGGGVVSQISDFWVTTNVSYAKQSNVITFFGAIYIYAGIIKGLIFTSFFALASYLLFIITIVKRRLHYLIVYLFIGSSLMLGWFDFYFNNLFYYEVVLYVLFVVFVSKIFSFISLWVNTKKLV
jgi:hypothetical protein